VYAGSGRNIIFVVGEDAVFRGILFSSAAEPKLFVLAAAPAPTFKKFPLRLRSRLRLRLQLCGYLFAQLSN
jgi:hypothetical protein